MDPTNNGPRYVIRGDVASRVTTDDSRVGEIAPVMVSLQLSRLAELEGKISQV